jgi:hypothetical protein
LPIPPMLWQKLALPGSPITEAVWNEFLRGTGEQSSEMENA